MKNEPNENKWYTLEEAAEEIGYNCDKQDILQALQNLGWLLSFSRTKLRVNDNYNSMIRGQWPHFELSRKGINSARIESVVCRSRRIEQEKDSIEQKKKPKTRKRLPVFQAR